MKAVRPAEQGDIPRLREIERAAGRPFAAFGMHAVADDEPPAPEVLAAHVERATAWVHVAEGVVAAYALAAVVDGDAHLDQVSVDPAFAHRRLGRDLIEHVAAWPVPAYGLDAWPHGCMRREILRNSSGDGVEDPAASPTGR